MKNKLLLIASLLSLFFSISASADNVTKVVITVAEPVVGKSCSFKASVPETASTKVTEVFWTGLFDDGKCVKGQDYTITVKVKIKDGVQRKFTTSGNMNVTINGHKARITVAGEKSLTAKYTWKAVGGIDTDNPEYKLKEQLKELAQAYTATNASDNKEILEYLKRSLPRAEIWLAGGSYSSVKKLPTATNDGRFSTTIGIKHNGVTIDRHTFSVKIPALEKSAEATSLNADVALMKAALKDLFVDAKTTGNDLLAAVNAAATNGAKAAWDKDYKYNAPTAKLQGSIEGNIVVTLGDKRDIFAVHKVLPKAGTATDAAIDADFSALSKALNNYAVSNKTTQQELLDIAHSVLKNGSKLVCTSFTKTDATYYDEGKIVLNFELELDGVKRIPRISRKISKIRVALPEGLAISHNEWEVLRLTNRERYKTGAAPLMMVAPLVEASDIRAKEITIDYRKDHKRPDGSSCFTAIEPKFSASRAAKGENAYRSPSTPAQAVAGWMNSPGHKANILNNNYTYIGCGATDEKDFKHWIQIFTSGTGVVEATTNTGSYHFDTLIDMEDAYLICVTSEGLVAYVPLDTGYMVQDGNQYTIHLRGKSVTMTVGADSN